MAKYRDILLFLNKTTVHNPDSYQDVNRKGAASNMLLAEIIQIQKELDLSKNPALLIKNA